MLRGGQNFWVGLLFSEFSDDLRNKEKRSSCQFGLRLFEFPVDLQNKKVISLNYSTYLLVFCRFTKKGHHLETAVRGRGVWLDMLGILGGRNFCLGGAAPFCSPPRSCGPVNTNPEHNTISCRNRIFTVLQCLTILLSYTKCFVSILLQSVVLNLLYNKIGMASELNLSNQLE